MYGTPTLNMYPFCVKKKNLTSFKAPLQITQFLTCAVLSVVRNLKLKLMIFPFVVWDEKHYVCIDTESVEF